jgi:hypothetical protein
MAFDADIGHSVSISGGGVPIDIWPVGWIELVVSRSVGERVVIALS